jgi:hypothetical protein
VLINARTPCLRALRQLFPRKPPVHGNAPDRLRAVFKAAGRIESDKVFRKLCWRIEHLRNIAVHHTLDRQNDRRPPQVAELFRKFASAIEALDITGHPPSVREQMHEYLIAAIEEVAALSYEERAARSAATAEAREWAEEGRRTAANAQAVVAYWRDYYERQGCCRTPRSAQGVEPPRPGGQDWRVRNRRLAGILARRREGLKCAEALNRCAIAR